MLIRKTENVLEIFHSQIDHHWQAIIDRLDSGNKIAIIFMGDECEFSGKLITLRKYQDLVYYILYLSRSIQLTEFPQNLPIWIQPEIYALPQSFSKNKFDTLTCEETYQFLCALREKGVACKVLPYRDFQLQMSFAPVEMIFNFRRNFQRPTISVIIPTKNYGEFLPNVIRHLIDQDMDPDTYEIIIIDDSSDDDSSEIIKNLVYPIKATINLQYHYAYREEFEAEHFRAGYCRNIGISLSQGENIIFLDSDMIVPRHFLTTAANALKEFDVIQFPRRHIRPEKSSIGTRIDSLAEADTYVEEKNYWQPFFESSNWMTLPQFWRYACTYGLGVRKSQLKEVGTFRDVFRQYGFEDTELAFRLARNGAKFQLVKSDIFHLTPPAQKSRYKHSQIVRQLMLAKTAKIFFLSTLDPEIYFFTQHYLKGESRWIQKLNEIFS